MADWHDIENCVASEVCVKRFKSKELESRNCTKHFVSPCADWSHTTSNLNATRESRASTVEGPFAIRNE